MRQRTVRAAVHIAAARLIVVGDRVRPGLRGNAVDSESAAGRQDDLPAVQI